MVPITPNALYSARRSIKAAAAQAGFGRVVASRKRGLAPMRESGTPWLNGGTARPSPRPGARVAGPAAHSWLAAVPVAAATSRCCRSSSPRLSPAPPAPFRQLLIRCAAHRFKAHSSVKLAAAHAPHGRQGPPPPPRARSHCRFAPPLIHSIPHSRTYSVPLFLKQQCGRALRPPGARHRRPSPHLERFRPSDNRSKAF
jgi:hypothetical protein